MNFIIRWIVTAISVAAAVWLVPGIEILSNSASWVGIVFFALILSLINMSIKPILQILSLDRKSTRLNSSHVRTSRMPSSA